MIRSVSWFFALFVATAIGFSVTTEATVRNINVSNFQFSPTHTIANMGDTIQWTFVSGTHTTTSDATSPKMWDSGNRSSGTFRIVLDRADGPGPFPYHCEVHPMMIDTIFISPTHDGDGDGISDIMDNCPFEANPSQVDSDMDQYGSVCDCDDAQTSIHTGATEILNDGIDQDCNGFDAVTCFQDADQDGFGTGTVVVAADGSCDAAQSESAVSGDCNDADTGIYPGATEIPDDGIDQDCNGSDLAGSCCVLRVGDVNSSGNDEPSIGDVSVLIDAEFISGTCTGTIACLTEADINQSGGGAPTCNDITIGDISVLIDYLFITGPTRGLPNCL